MQKSNPPDSAVREESKSSYTEEDQQHILTTLEQAGVIEDSYDYALKLNKHHNNIIVPALKSLEANLLITTQGDAPKKSVIEKTSYQLTEEALVSTSFTL